MVVIRLWLKCEQHCAFDFTSVDLNQKLVLGLMMHKGREQQSLHDSIIETSRMLVMIGIKGCKLSVVI